MSHTPADDPQLDAEQETAVRRALAAAGGPVTMPAELAERLDGVIAELASGRTASAAPAVIATRSDGSPIAPGDPTPGQVVVPLDAATRRRRARARVVLVAAASLVALGVGVGVFGNQQGADDLTAAESLAEGEPTRVPSAAMSERGPVATDAEAAPPAGAGGSLDEDDSRTTDRSGVTDLRRLQSKEPLRTVHATSLRADLVALQHLALPDPNVADYSGITLRAPAEFRCEQADYGRGHFIGILYDDQPAIVSFHRPMGSTQVAEVLACGTGDILHSTTIPVN